MADHLEDEDREEKVVSNCVKIADLLEEILISELQGDVDEHGKMTGPTAAMVGVARQYLKDQGFVAAKRPNANLTPIAKGVEKAQRDGEMPFPVSESS